MSKKKSSRKPVASTKPSKTPMSFPVWRLVAASLVAALSFLFVIGPEKTAFFSGTLIVRGLLTGLAAGLLFERKEWGYAAATALIGSVIGLIAVATANTPISAGTMMLGAVILPPLAAGLIARFLPREPEWFTVGIVIVVLSGTLFWSLGVIGGPLKSELSTVRAKAAAVPQAEQYAIDPYIFIKTVDYMRSGLGYYQSFQLAWDEDSRQAGTVPGALNFREPTLFVLWNYLPGATGGTAILNGFIFWAWLGVILTWFAARKFVNDGVAMLGAQLMVSFYVYAALGGMWFTLAELWASVVVIGAVALLVRRQFLASAILITLAVAFRELSAIYLPAWAIAWWFGGERKRWLPGLIVAFAGPLLALGIHIDSAPAANSGGLPSLQEWMHSTGIPRTLTAIRFGGLFPYYQTLLPTIAVASVVGGALVKESWLRWTLLFVALVPLVFLTAFSKSEWDYYWALNFQTTMAMLASLVFVRVFPSRGATTAP
ncbi:MAG: hypothetical protein HGB10_05040 [Coriobacteriia bacterium]|nr:hypothetical protein [Coriobacteriia bacterium]